jgi:Kef-type K+ transport system membrane component KefB
VGKQVAAGKTTRDMFAIVCVTLLLAGLTTEQIGIHAVFGAFLIGTVIPCESALARDIREKCEDLAVVLLLPVFFAFTGLRTQVGLLKEPRHWLICILIILVGSLGKFGGGYAAALCSAKKSVHREFIVTNSHETHSCCSQHTRGMPPAP